MSQKVDIEVGIPKIASIKYGWEKALKDPKTNEKQIKRILKSFLISLETLKMETSETEIELFLKILRDEGHLSQLKDKDMKIVLRLNEILNEKLKEKKNLMDKAYSDLFGLWKSIFTIYDSQRTLVLRISRENEELIADMDYSYQKRGKEKIYTHVIKIYYDLTIIKNEIHLRYERHSIIQMGWDNCGDYIPENYILRLSSRNQELIGKRIDINGEIDIRFEKMKIN